MHYMHAMDSPTHKPVGTGKGWSSHISHRSNKEKETYLRWTYHEETRQPGEGHYNGDSTRKTGKKQAKNIMDEQYYCMDWANVKMLY